VRKPKRLITHTRKLLLTVNTPIKRLLRQRPIGGTPRYWGAFRRGCLSDTSKMLLSVNTPIKHLYYQRFGTSPGSHMWLRFLQANFMQTRAAVSHGLFLSVYAPLKARDPIDRTPRCWGLCRQPNSPPHAWMSENASVGLRTNQAYPLTATLGPYLDLATSHMSAQLLFLSVVSEPGQQRAQRAKARVFYRLSGKTSGARSRGEVAEEEGRSCDVDGRHSSAGGGENFARRS
jgi:hypothetical protein